MNEPVGVRSPGVEQALLARIEAVAERLSVALDVEAGPVGRPTTVGDVTLRPDDPEWRIEAALLRAVGPEHILFLCVANSARSQLAEGIARSLSDGKSTISSAGSEPTSVRPRAVEVLAEIGIDISGQRSKSVDDVSRDVDAVVTLCAEEVCPVWLGPARRLHWGLPDPAGVGGGGPEELEAFRSVRDELRRRLGVLFQGG